ncbi:protein canopy homolog 4 isoform 2-T2 [Rhynchonycteris naso]
MFVYLSCPPGHLVCKLLSLELQEKLSRTGRSREVLELGQVLDTGKRKKHVPYSVSETRLEEALENLCEQILDYSVHAERKGSLRYAKGQSQTMSTLKGLVQKGVKVDLGIPLELWDEPSVEVTFLKKQCETMLEEFEDVVGDWYFHHQEQPLQHFLCEGHVLPAAETACLQEIWTEKEITDGQEKTEGEEEQDQEEKEKEEEITNTPGHPKHDPEDL